MGERGIKASFRAVCFARGTSAAFAGIAQFQGAVRDTHQRRFNGGCGVRDLKGIRWTSKSTLDRASKLFSREQLRQMNDLLAEVEFGNALYLAESQEGFILDYRLYQGQATADTVKLLEGLDRQESLDIEASIRAVVCARGFDSRKVAAELVERRIENMICPRNPANRTGSILVALHSPEAGSAPQSIVILLIWCAEDHTPGYVFKTHPPQAEVPAENTPT